jgi:hypothetical protein
MPLFVEDFRSQIFRSSTHRIGIVVGNIHLGKTEICEAEIPFLVNKNVFRFETK